jgi:eRF1 domain 3
VHIVSNASPEGSQFCAGFGGFGAILRYPMEMPEFDDDGDAIDVAELQLGGDDDDNSGDEI